MDVFNHPKINSKKIDDVIFALNETVIKDYFRLIDGEKLDACKNYMDTSIVLYNLSKSMKDKDFDKKMLPFFQEILGTYIGKQRKLLQNYGGDKTHQNILFSNVVMNFNDYDLFLKGLTKRFSYVNIQLSQNSKDNQDLYTKGIQYYYDNVYTNLHSKFVDYIVFIIKKERHVDCEYTECIKQLIEIIWKIDTYADHKIYKNINEVILSITTEHCDKLYSKLRKDATNCIEYLETIDSFISRERKKSEYYFCKKNWNDLIKVFNSVLLEKYTLDLINGDRGLDHMVSTNNIKGISLICEHYTDIKESILKISDAFANYIVKRGNIIIQNIPAKIKVTIDFLSHIENMISSLDNIYFRNGMIKGFKLLINSIEKYPIDLARYIHELMKSNKNNILDIVDNIVLFYELLHDKDIFEGEYQRNLSTRLLNNCSTSYDTEKTIISKFKASCGYNWCSNLEHMFSDILLSMDLNRDHGQSQIFSANVCAMCRWPIKNDRDPFIYPNVFRKYISDFNEFYKIKNPGRKLSWKLNMGVCELKVFFPKGPRILFVTPYQAGILLLFAEKEIYKLEQIMDITGLSFDLIYPHIISLAHPKVGILLKKPNTNTLDRNHVFKINSSYTSQLLKVKIPLIKKKSTIIEADKKTFDSIIRDRKIMVESSIVRIMKSRKNERHNILVSEVIRQVKPKFIPDPRFIKKCIEHLIDGEYIKRNEDDRKLYQYMA